jgi:UDP-glucose 4-epimerase
MSTHIGNLEGNVVVTGGAGFIGSHLVERLLAMGCGVTVIDNLSSGKKEHIDMFGGNVRFILGDVNDINQMMDAAQNARYIFHLAAIPSVPQSIADPVGSNHTNINGTLSVLTAARKMGVQRVIFSSSSAVYGDAVSLPITEDAHPSPLSPYAIQKLAGEHYMRVFARSYGMETVSLRYFNVFGPRQDPRSSYAGVIPLFVSALSDARKPTIYGDGLATRDFISVHDVVEANVLAALHGSGIGDVYNIGSGVQTSVMELFQVIADVMESNIKPVCNVAREGDIKDSLADIAKAQYELGFQPRVLFRDGVKEVVESLLCSE